VRLESTAATAIVLGHFAGLNPITSTFEFHAHAIAIVHFDNA